METTLNKADRKIFIKPVKRQQWSGFPRYPKCQVTLVARLSTTGYITGLSSEEEERLERELLLEPGTLSRFSKYWRDYTVRIPEDGKELDLSNPKHELEYHVLRSSHKVSPSRKEPRAGAEFMIEDLAEEAKEENVKMSIKVEAFRILNAMSGEDFDNFLKLLGKRPEGLSIEMKQNEVMKYADDNPAGFLATNRLDHKAQRILVEDCINAGLVKKVNGLWHFGEHSLGYDRAAAAEFLAAPKNQELELTLKQRLESM